MTSRNYLYFIYRIKQHHCHQQDGVFGSPDVDKYSLLNKVFYVLSIHQLYICNMLLYLIKQQYLSKSRGDLADMTFTYIIHMSTKFAKHRHHHPLYSCYIN